MMKTQGALSGMPAARNASSSDWSPLIRTKKNPLPHAWYDCFGLTLLGNRKLTGRAREELTGAQSEIERFKTANTELEKEIASLHAHSKSATETARQTLIVMEEKIEELNAALVGAGRVETTPTESPPANQRADISTQKPTTAPAQVDASGLERFDANVRSLNSRALEVAGADLFSGIKSAGDGVVHVSTTPAWENIPSAGQRSYLNSLFRLWTVAREGGGPAVVRIVDSSGQVLLEQSGTAKDGARD
jgi:hypothetical protein